MAVSNSYWDEAALDIEYRRLGLSKTRSSPQNKKHPQVSA
jgi:hypothetical protein